MPQLASWLGLFAYAAATDPDLVFPCRAGVGWECAVAEKGGAQPGGEGYLRVQRMLTSILCRGQNEAPGGGQDEGRADIRAPSGLSDTLSC
jgi:hypothetical protein